MTGWYTSIFIILQIVCSSILVQSAIYRQTSQILCLFTLSNCHPDHQFECQNAKLNLKRMKHHYDKTVYFQPLRYCFMDMKNSSKILVETLLPIVLDRKPKNIRCMPNGGFFGYSLKRVIIFTYLDFHLTRVASSILLSETPATLPVLLSSVTDEPMYPAFYLEHPLAFYSYESVLDIHVIAQIKKEIKVDYMAMLNLRDEKTTNDTKDYHQSCTADTFLCKYVKKYPDDCVKILDVNVYDDKDVENSLRLIRRDNITFILCVGDSQLLSTFRTKVGINKEMYQKEAFVEVPKLKTSFARVFNYCTEKNSLYKTPLSLAFPAQNHEMKLRENFFPEIFFPQKFLFFPFFFLGRNLLDMLNFISMLFF